MSVKIPRQFYSSNRNLPRTLLTAPTIEPTIKKEKRVFDGMSPEQITLMVCPGQFRQVYISITDTLGEKFKELGLVVEDKKVIGGPLDVLLNWALTPENSDYEFSKILLVNYRVYCKSVELLQLVDKRCEEILQLTGEPEKSLKQKWAKITIFMKNWTELLPHDFVESDMEKGIKDFIEKYSSQFAGIAQVKKMVDNAKSLKPNFDIFEKVETESKSKIGDKLKNLNELTAEQIAQQLSLYEFELFKSIETKDFLGSAWTKKDKYERCPQLCYFLDHFNGVTNWVSSTLVNEPDAQVRAQLISKYIDVAKIMYDNLNFTGFFEFYSGINSSVVSRLTKTMELVPNASERLEPMRKAADPSKSYAAYRKYILENKTKGYIPFIGVVIQDLTFIDEGNPDKTEKGDVNFEKCRMMAKQLFVIKELQDNQHSAFKPLPFFKDFITLVGSHKEDTENALYQLSLKIQPRGN
ncbi:RAS guanyl-releasing protein, putative [Entamoeba invadens IP1]|uniref:RAS guanyl-releasing protein, putative n=1 Tax=Entamoeba invadens TaxID=33085 RepID=S0B4A0_ENTIV|nr:RAS guanyl-releasing protein, putative [Entamoeba invadens IP1]ELP90667.1 RAS guanyl-releasing protein, putative [Entamoeba invadens IP1]BAN41889.1 RAS guanyl-releasing protein, putative [Entamoeba invadens]BAN42049.1 RAS guanyl-releasing protein, putative [Entamoeba invadens]|eukprot:XP_004257438.1 RAS guanyl-releasing protein, putative [Entamoeba invadens IP1]